MAIDFKKYLESKSIHYISNSGSDEKGGTKNGSAGDQTGKEWQLKAWYNRPWTVVLRYPDPAVGIKMAELGIAAALNNKIGYDQNQRTTYWTQLQKAGYDPSKITTACEEDCTAGVTANAKAVGYLMGIKKLQDLRTDTYSGNMRSRFVTAGFKALTAKKYLTGPKYLLPGDVLLYEGHHAAMNITFGSKVASTKITDTTITPSVSKIPAIDEPAPAAGSASGYVLVYNGSYHIRLASSTSGASIGIAEAGDRLPYLGEKTNGWFKVGYDGKVCWISEKAGKVVTTTNLIVKSGTWNIRSLAGTNGKVLGIVKTGDSLCNLDQSSGNWKKIYFNGVAGWVSNKAF